MLSHDYTVLLPLSLANFRRLDIGPNWRDSETRAGVRRPLCTAAFAWRRLGLIDVDITPGHSGDARSSTGPGNELGLSISVEMSVLLLFLFSMDQMIDKMDTAASGYGSVDDIY